MDEGFCSCVGVLEVKEGCFSDVLYVLVEGGASDTLFNGNFCW